jgi:hypothetical protein
MVLYIPDVDCRFFSNLPLHGVFEGFSGFHETRKRGIKLPGPLFLQRWKKKKKK